MRILLAHRDIHNDVNRGGICRIYISLAKQFVEKGHDVYLVSGTTSPKDMAAYGRQICIEETKTHDEYLRKVLEIATEINPDICECSTWEYELLQYAKQANRAPVIVRGDLTANSLGIKSMVAGEQDLLQNCDDVICVSRFAQKDLQRSYGVTHSTIISNAVDSDLFSPIPPKDAVNLNSGDIISLDEKGEITSRREIVADPSEFRAFIARKETPLVMWCGKITEMKGWDTFENIVHKLRGKARFLVLLGHSKAYYPLTIHSLPDVMFIQNISNVDMPKIYSLSDYYISTSRWEGFGLSILEAMSCGKTVFLPETLEVWPELIEPNLTGFLYNTAADIENCISKRMSLVPQINPKYTWEYNSSQTLKVYESAILRKKLETKHV